VDIRPVDILAQRQDVWIARPTLKAIDQEQSLATVHHAIAGSPAARSPRGSSSPTVICPNAAGMSGSHPCDLGQDAGCAGHRLQDARLADTSAHCLGAHGAIFFSSPSLPPDVPRTTGMRQTETQPAVSRHSAAEIPGLSRGHPSRGHTRTASRRLDRASYAKSSRPRKRLDGVLVASNVRCRSTACE
jgi:hypothetical protein